MPAYKTPGVYVEEIATLPPSVADVTTAVPAFLGYTELQPQNNRPIRITSLVEFAEYFGGPKPTPFTVTMESGDLKATPELSDATRTPLYLMYYSLKLYFDNGGGPCYVVSVGSYNVARQLSDFTSGLSLLAHEDEPTLILLTDAVNLSTSDYCEICKAALAQCNKLGDRFAILDVPGDDKVEAFRTGIGMKDLKYGAAYYPFVQSALLYEFEEQQVSVKWPYIWQQTTGFEGMKVGFVPPVPATAKVKITEDPAAAADSVAFVWGTGVLNIKIKKDAAGIAAKTVVTEFDKWKSANLPDTFRIEVAPDTGADPMVHAAPETIVSKEPANVSSLLISYAPTAPPSPKITISEGAAAVNVSGEHLVLTVPAGTTAAALVEEWNTWKAKPGHDPGGFNVTRIGKGSAPFTAVTGQILEREPPQKLDTLKDSQTQIYNQVKAAISRQRIVMPPSAAIAGVYAAVDRDRGVWKAPANVSLASVLGPTKKITDDDQENLNVDPTAGKSINAIRSFAGKGTLVWGARTLAGNDNEWRYINVRRLFNMIEEATRKASAFAVFEANDATTWLKVKGMIDSYLYGLWERGALAGPTAEGAYFVNVGLGKTMTAQQVLDGVMIVEIGAAAVRPAEFIIIRFSHKLQEA